ncbi:pentapeptide repeat-containing protein [Leptothoe spongobia TAU-MAC 1115]|uniref:Pentapeptide repeat-containing protein n=2 Tax=Leptothoe TaxID=2651725 RepID=A0A947GKS3_9CYAN|nr:pentapeptide repeat-containing protein [Leptothoe spongobia TAU-MAC 1115]
MRRNWKHHNEKEKIAFELYRTRLLFGKVDKGVKDKDWETAEKILTSPLRRALFSINRPLVKLEKHLIQPSRRYLNQLAIFDIVDRLSSTILTITLLSILIVLVYASLLYENGREKRESDRLQQATMEYYLSQLSNILLNVEGDLEADRNQAIRTIVNATTATLLRDPNLDGQRKGQIIVFLSQMDFVQSKQNDGLEIKQPIVSLSGADLSGADLNNANLSGADLSGADLSGADLSGADLSDANLSGVDLNYANLIRANLSGTDLSGTDLSDANLSGTDLNGTDLSDAIIQHTVLIGTNLTGANLTGADLTGADLVGANLTNANLDEKQLQKSYLCKSILPEDFATDPNRTCPR